LRNHCSIILIRKYWS